MGVRLQTTFQGSRVSHEHATEAVSERFWPANSHTHTSKLGTKGRRILKRGGRASGEFLERNLLRAYCGRHSGKGERRLSPAKEVGRRYDSVKYSASPSLFPCIFNFASILFRLTFP